MKIKNYLILILISIIASNVLAQNALVFQTDFGEKDGAVAAMKGVAVGVAGNLNIFDLTHEIPPFNVWEAAYRLEQTAKYWPAGTVFVSVVDPGVGTERKSVVLKTKSGHLFVTPDNGTLTLVAASLEIEAVREIDEAINRLKNSEESYTFHGRDVYAYTGARLAANVISFEEVGAELPPEVVSIPFQKPALENGVLKGNIPILDINYGNVWTNISRDDYRQLNVSPGQEIWVKISSKSDIIFEEKISYENTFGAVKIGQPLVYLNSLNNISMAINQGSFSEKYNIRSGPEWSVELWK